MGKNKKSKNQPSASAGPKCTCDHPYNCSCGNRPARPSKGHKWDPETQQWGGKGHKQKGASGQTRVVGQETKTTEVGKTQIAQWQKLPSNILREYCQKQKRPPPKFKELMNDHTKQKFKVRCIVPDSKDRDKDLILVPACPVANEEQAKEESALLALLQLTPNLPHERKLPEPYKTTWITAVQAQKDDRKSRDTKSKTPNAGTKATANNAHTGSKANTNLVLGTTHVSAADRRRQKEEKKRERNARIRKHEAIRMANRNHPVFLSATLRTQIQRLLRGDTVVLEDPAEDNEILDNYSSDRQAYVEERLHQEGFTKRQARTAFQKELAKAKHARDTDDEDQWEHLYDDCLQWLCVHLEEDQLPEGFNPKGQTLDVVAHPGTKTKANQKVSLEAQEVAKRYGLSHDDASWLLGQKETSVEDTLWKACCQLANVSTKLESIAGSSEENQQLVQEEIEALEAIFPSECQIMSNDGISSIVIQTPEELTLSIVFASGQYPSVRPQRVLCSGNWPQRNGVAFHVEIAKFVSTLELGEPMVFEIYGQVQQLLQTVGDLPSLKLQRTEQLKVSSSTTEGRTTTEGQNKSRRQSSPSLILRRPRQRSVFWSTRPSNTPPAVAHPKLSKSLEDQRKGLPAGHARKDFLSVLKKADDVSFASAFDFSSENLDMSLLALLFLTPYQSSRVLLVTGDTGCGKLYVCKKCLMGASCFSNFLAFRR